MPALTHQLHLSNVLYVSVANERQQEANDELVKYFVSSVDITFCVSFFQTFDALFF